LLARVASGFGEFFQDVLQSGQADFGRGVFFGFDGSSAGGVLEEFADGAAEVGGSNIPWGWRVGVERT
jgi:hypothetical protein